MAIPEPSVREPQQQRSRDTLERMLQAGVELLAAGGWEAVTVGEINRRTGISRGAFYKRFTSKEALWQAISARVLAELWTDQERAFAEVEWGGLEAPAAIERAVRVVAGIFERHGAIMKMMRGPVPTQEAVLRDGAAALRLDRHFLDALRPHQPRFAHPDPETATGFCLRIVLDVLLARVVQDVALPAGRRLEWDGMVDELARVSLGYLLGGHPAPPGS
jgi:AcrR family transcriptional regulator